MSESQKPTIDVTPPDAGAGFRAEMAFSNFVIGYWKHAVLLAVLGLLGVFVYGQYSSWHLNHQHSASAQLAAEQSKILEVAVAALPDEETRAQVERYGFRPEILGSIGAQLAPLDDATKAKFTASAEAMAAIGAASTDAASAEAWTSAAELYKITGDNEKRLAALVQASSKTSGVLRFTLEMSIAHLELDTGKADEAVVRLKSLVADANPYFAQEAALDLGAVYESQSKNPEALAVYADFLQKWPEAPGAKKAQERQTALGGSPAPAKTEEAPKEGDAPKPEGEAPAGEGK